MNVYPLHQVSLSAPLGRFFMRRKYIANASLAPSATSYADPIHTKTFTCLGEPSSGDATSAFPYLLATVFDQFTIFV